MLFRIKSVTVALVALAVALSLSGCAFIPADITELESPPKLTAEQQSIEAALEKAEGTKLTLKYPLEGDYRSAFVLKDLYNNGTEQALAFFSPPSGAGTYIDVLEKVNGNWEVSSKIGSDGTEIDSVAFGDFNGDGQDEIAVGWRSVSLTDLTLVVYSKKGLKYSKSNLGTFTAMKTLDMNGDGRTDILLLQLAGDVAKARASLISYRDSKFEEVATSPLDSTVTNYVGVYTTKLASGETGVLIDGKKGDDKMITELVYYKNGKLVSPLYDNSKHTVTSTLRYVDYRCEDIDGDGTIEVPMPVELPYVPNAKDTNQNWLVRWSTYDTKKGFIPKFSAIMNYTEGYYFKYPEKWDPKKVTVSKRVGDDVWDFCRWDSAKNTYGKVLFTVSVYTDDVWNNLPDKDGYIKLAEKNGTVYLVQIPSQAPGDPLALTLPEIEKNFRLIS